MVNRKYWVFISVCRYTFITFTCLNINVLKFKKMVRSTHTFIIYFTNLDYLHRVFHKCKAPVLAVSLCLKRSLLIVFSSVSYALCAIVYILKWNMLNITPFYCPHGHKSISITQLFPGHKVHFKNLKRHFFPLVRMYWKIHYFCVSAWTAPASWETHITFSTIYCASKKVCFSCLFLSLPPGSC